MSCWYDHTPGTSILGLVWKWHLVWTLSVLVNRWWGAQSLITQSSTRLASFSHTHTHTLRAFRLSHLRFETHLGPCGQWSWQHAQVYSAWPKANLITWQNHFACFITWARSWAQTWVGQHNARVFLHTDVGVPCINELLSKQHLFPWNFEVKFSQTDLPQKNLHLL